MFIMYTLLLFYISNVSATQHFWCVYWAVRILCTPVVSIKPRRFKITIWVRAQKYKWHLLNLSFWQWWLNSTVLWFVTRCRSQRAQCFGGRYRFYLHGKKRKINQATGRSRRQYLVWSWRWKQYVNTKCRATSKVHEVTTQKILLLDYYL